MVQAETRYFQSLLQAVTKWRKGYHGIWLCPPKRGNQSGFRRRHSFIPFLAGGETLSLKFVSGHRQNFNTGSNFGTIGGTSNGTSNAGNTRLTPGRLARVFPNRRRAVSSWHPVWHRQIGGEDWLEVGAALRPAPATTASLNRFFFIALVVHPCDWKPREQQPEKISSDVHSTVNGMGGMRC